MSTQAATYSRHAKLRAQQRGIPPLIEEWLDEFGELVYDGRGAATRYFSHRSIRRMERAFGREIVRNMARYLDIYKVEGSSDASIITIGHRTGRVRRKTRKSRRVRMIFPPKDWHVEESRAP
jgi:hypothetical protein